MSTQRGEALAHAPPRRRHLDVVAAIALLVLLAGVAQMFLGALRVGVTWDEPIHVERTQALFDTGWYLPPAEQADTGAEAELRRYVYGPTFSLLAHGVNVVAGVEDAGTISTSAAAYAGRHLVLAALGTVGALAVGFAVWTLTSSRRSALWSAAALTALPAWTGHAMFNGKDLPAAVGYTLLTVALVLALVADPPGPLHRVRGPLVVVGVGLGVFLGFGTRLALWVPIGVTVVAFLALWGLRAATGRAVWRHAPVLVATGALLGLLGTAAAYPRAASRPWALLRGSVEASSAFPWRGYTLTAGQLLPAQDLPWWYLPTWFAARTPVLLAILAAVGAVLVVVALLRADPHASWLGAAHATAPAAAPGATSQARVLRWVPSDSTAGALLVLLQATMLPAGAVVLGSVLYDGLRQHLYAVPALAVLAGLAAHRLAAVHLDAATAPRWRRAVGTAVLSLALLVPAVEQALLFPFNYTYINPVAGLGGIEGRWETDYWRAAGREATTRVPTDAELRCSALELPRTGQPAGLWACGPDITPFAHLRGTDVAADADDHEGVWVIGRRREGATPPAACTSVDDVTRWVRGERVVMMHVLVCDPEAF